MNTFLNVAEINEFTGKAVSTKWASKGIKWILFAFRNPKVSSFRHMYYKSGDTKAILKSFRSNKTFEVNIVDLIKLPDYINKPVIKNQEYMPCTICNEREAWVGGGYDTCASCLGIMAQQSYKTAV